MDEILERLVPKKVRFVEGDWMAEMCRCYYMCQCPTCDLEVITFDEKDWHEHSREGDTPEEKFKSFMVHHAYMDLNNYCNRCGQKLDWGEYPRREVIF